jgi:predicted phosphoribosyltransferase
MTPATLGGIGGWYVDFRQTTDDEVRELLTRAASERRA